MTTPTPRTNPLVDVLAEWEDKFGAMAAIMPHEWAELFNAVTQACIVQSPRQLRRDLAAAQEARQLEFEKRMAIVAENCEYKERAQRAEALAESNARDAERLDWAEANPVKAYGRIVGQWAECGRGCREQFFNFRTAIDAAIAGEKK